MSTGTHAGRVFVAGAAHRDLVLNVRVLPDEGETLNATDMSWGFGGKAANQAVAAAAVAERVHFVGLVGRDEAGAAVLRNLADRGVDVSLARSDGASGLAVVTVNDQGDNHIVVARGTGFAAEGQPASDLRIAWADVVVLQCESSRTELLGLIDAAHAQGACVVLNLAPYIDLPEKVLRQASFLILNESEARALSSHLFSDAAADAERLANELNLRCVITLGADGADFAEPGKGVVRVDAHPPEQVADTTGAGDAFVGTFAGALASGTPVNDALYIATRAASRCVEHEGAQPQLSTA